MFLGWCTLLYCLLRATFWPGDSPVRFTRNRLMVIYFYLPIVVLIAAFHTICLLLDELLFPGYRRVKMKPPLIIVGPPRSGTTFLHRVLAKDTERFATLPFGEMVWTPSIVERYMLAGADWIDRRFGRPLYRLLAHLEKAWFDPYADMHRVSMFEPEEDFVMLGYCFANHLLMVLFPFEDVFGYLYRFDEEASPREKKRLLRFYKRCLQRHLYFHGAEKIFLSKNPFFTSFIKSLEEELPEPRFLCNIRTPYETVPSFLSVWSVMYDGIGNDTSHYLAREFVLDWLLQTYTYGADQMEQRDPARAGIALYEPLIQSPKATVLGYYANFGFEASARYLAVLDVEQERARGYKSRHKYSLTEFGYSEAQIYERFRSVFDRFGFEPEPPRGGEDKATSGYADMI